MRLCLRTSCVSNESTLGALFSSTRYLIDINLYNKYISQLRKSGLVLRRQFLYDLIIDKLKHIETCASARRIESTHLLNK